jgi:VanZ family protein
VLKTILLVIALLYTIALAIVSLISSDNLPNLEVANSDKIAHLIAYGILCLVWYLALKNSKLSKPLLIASSIAIFYGIILEVLQGTFTAERISEGYDILANCFGVVIISIIIIIIRNKTHVKKI